MTNTRHLLCPVERIPDGGAIELRVRGEQPTFLVLLRRGSEIRAYYNACPHAGQPLNIGPDRFLFTPEGRLVCAAHGATFEVDSGVCIQGPCTGAHLRCYPIEIEEGAVFAAGR